MFSKLVGSSSNIRNSAKLARIIMETEISAKTSRKKKNKKRNSQIINGSERFASTYCNNICQSHIKKLSKLRNETKLTSGQNPAIYIRQTVHNFSSFHLTTEEEKALSLCLNEHIPTSLNRNKLFIEFEIFYQNNLKDLPNLPEHDTMALKSKLRHTCKKYSKIKVPYKHLTVTDNLRPNKDIVILKQDKSKGVVLLDRTVYIDKCLSILNTQKVQRLDISPTAANEYKIQLVLRRI